MMEIICKNIEDTKKLAAALCDVVREDGCFISLFGDIGCGKTAFVKGVLEALGVKKAVTSPSFVIMNQYGTTPDSPHIPVYHFDLYRLENEGLNTIENELREYSKHGVLTFVEWANFGGEQLPFERLNITIAVGENEERIFKLEPQGPKAQEIVRKIPA
jgi:tRNA threonylcarbamoyladenosine biosynthesis protein TsaE